LLNFKNIFLCVQSRLPAGNKPFYILLLVISFVFHSQTTYAQTNLIYNGDFELYDTCPVNVSNPGDYQIETCLGWKSPTYATSDYYNSCASWPVGIPSNIFGLKSPYSGNAYCGILINYVAPPISSYGYWFEYIQGNLVSSLKPGFEYKFSCHVALSNILYEFGFSNFGAAFSSATIYKNDAKPFETTITQILNSNNNYLIDTLNWVKIEGTFYAKGGEQNITLGFFSDTNNLDTLRNTPIVNLFQFGSYYYIDDCYLVETGKIYEYPNVFSPNGDGVNDEWNPSLFNGESVKIFNRWGIEVFEITGNNQKWDGRTTSGIECVDGVYFYVINNGTNDTNTIKKGFIQLVR